MSVFRLYHAFVHFYFLYNVFTPVDRRYKRVCRLPRKFLWMIWRRTRVRGSSFQLPILIVAGWLARLPYTSGPTTVLINAGDACYTSNRSDVDRYWVYRCTIRSNKRAADRHTRCLTVFCVPAGNWLNIGVDISRHTIRYDTRCCFTGRLKTQVRNT